ncbi:MAG: hypothetical protein GX299_10225 [Epulopiscium sp.]|jgi:hypothetical protein|nr:hypothetical protein [Candidatus Epulonipiscium sp.]
MLLEEFLEKNYQELDKLNQCLRTLNFQTQLYNVSENIPIPILVVGLKEDYKGDICAVNIAFTPFNDDDLEYTRFLQLSIDMAVEVNQNNEETLIRFANKVNSIIPMGNFVLTDNTLCYRFVYPIANTLEITHSSVLETISLYSLFFFQYDEIFAKLASGMLSYNEAVTASI